MWQVRNTITAPSIYLYGISSIFHPLPFYFLSLSLSSTAPPHPLSPHPRGERPVGLEANLKPINTSLCFFLCVSAQYRCPCLTRGREGASVWWLSRSVTVNPWRPLNTTPPNHCSECKRLSDWIQMRLISMPNPVVECVRRQESLPGNLINCRNGI